MFNSSVTGITAAPHATIPHIRNVAIVNNTVVGHPTCFYIRWDKAENVTLTNNAVYVWEQQLLTGRDLRALTGPSAAIMWNGCLIDKCLGCFDTKEDLPVVGDWDGTGIVRIGVFRPSTGMWYLDLNGNGKSDNCLVDACLGPFGQAGDLPVVGKW